jgi:hypothetical protein
MKRLLLFAAPALFAGGCSTENRLLDPVHTPLVAVTSDRTTDFRESPGVRPVTPAERQQRREMGAWPWP